MNTVAQLVCYDWNPQPRTRDLTDSEASLYGATSRSQIVPMMLQNCTLIYRKYLDHAVAHDSSDKVTAQTTPEGILVPHVIGNVTYSRSLTLSNPLKKDEVCYAFDGAKPLIVPILEVTVDGTVKYYFDYGANQEIGGLYKITGDSSEIAFTSDLYGLENSITGNLIPKLPIKLKDGTIPFAPLMERKVPLKLDQTVQGQATLTPDKVAAALTRHSVTNIIGTAMQRIATNHQGDIMLSDCV